MAKRKKEFDHKKIKTVITVIAIIVFALYSIYYEFIEERKYGDVNEDDIKYSYHFINVGQGDATVILSGDDCVVIDCGTYESGMTVVKYIEMYTDDIDLLILTHPHEDHIGGAVDVLDSLDVKKVIMPDVVSNTSIFNHVIGGIEDNGSEVLRAEAGLNVSVGDISVDILGPLKIDEDDLNNCSVITKVTTEDISLMFTGDAESKVEKQLLNKYDTSVLDADILKVPHHGSSSSSSKAFLEAVSPKYGVISCAIDNGYGHPHTEVIELLRELEIEYYITYETDHTVFVSDGEHLALRQ